MATIENENFSSRVSESGETLAGQLFDTPLAEARGWLLGAEKEVVLLPAEDDGSPGVLIVSEDGSVFEREVELDGAALPGGYIEPASSAVCRQIESDGGQTLALFVRGREVEARGDAPVKLSPPKNAMEASHLALRLSMLTDRNPGA